MQASRETFGESSVSVIDAKTGKAVFEADRDKLARLVKKDYVVVSTVGLSPDRNVSIEFSPASDRLLVGSWDNTVRVFRIVE